MDIRTLRYFVEVVRQQSFTRAAEKLFVTQPTISKMLKNLEDELNCTLLIRDGRSADYKRELLKRLWSLLQASTGAADDQIVIGIQELPASQAMEMAAIMPDVNGTTQSRPA